MSDELAREAALIENIQRENLNPVEEAKAYQAILKHKNSNYDKLSDADNKSKSHISNTIRLLELEDEILNYVISGQLSMGHARALLGLENSKQMEILRKEIIKQDLTVRQTEGRVNKIKAGSVNKPGLSTAKKNIFIKDLEKDLARRLGTKVDISTKKNGGKLVVTYYSDDDLDRIQGLMGSKRK